MLFQSHLSYSCILQLMSCNFGYPSHYSYKAVCRTGRIDERQKLCVKALLLTVQPTLGSPKLFATHALQLRPSTKGGQLEHCPVIRSQLSSSSGQLQATKDKTVYNHGLQLCRENLTCTTIASQITVKWT